MDLCDKLSAFADFRKWGKLQISREFWSRLSGFSVLKYRSYIVNEVRITNLRSALPRLMLFPLFLFCRTMTPSYLIDYRGLLNTLNLCFGLFCNSKDEKYLKDQHKKQTSTDCCSETTLQKSFKVMWIWIWTKTRGLTNLGQKKNRPNRQICISLFTHYSLVWVSRRRHRGCFPVKKLPTVMHVH